MNGSPKVAVITGASQGIGFTQSAGWGRSATADGILYLEWASFVTGEIMHIDGGQAAGH